MEIGFLFWRGLCFVSFWCFDLISEVEVYIIGIGLYDNVYIVRLEKDIFVMLCMCSRFINKFIRCDVVIDFKFSLDVWID